MNSVRCSIALVRLWTRVYTYGLSPAVRDDRRAEIESDLWEFQRERGEAIDARDAAHLLARLIIGVADDLSWSLENIFHGNHAQATASSGIPREASVRLSAFSCALVFHVVAGVALVAGGSAC